MKARIFLTVALIFALSLSVYAQRGAIVRMSFFDSKSGDPVEFATASLTVKGKDNIYKYVLTGADGSAVFTSVAYGEYIVKCEFMGYKPFATEIKVDKSEVSLGKFKMELEPNLLEGAVVTAVANPVVIKKDTIEYSASSFKTTDNDMLEDLLKKLPGVEVDSDGSITANGETITKITIDGKTFFLDDPQLASKNIPANIINKVKVLEKKSEQAEFTGISDGNEETVIDLSIKPGMMDGWFGNVSAGGGLDLMKSVSEDGKTSWQTDPRWQGGAMVAKFSDDMQLSVIVNANNTNNRGFNDISSGMMSTMRGGRGMGRGVGGWGGFNGITTSWMAGANGNFNLLDDRMELGANYMYGGSLQEVEEDVSKTTFKTDGTSLLYNENGYSMTRSNGHRFGIELDHKFTENTSIFFRPQFNFGSGYFKETSDYSTNTDISALTGNQSDILESNSGNSFTDGISNSWEARGFFLFRQRLGKPGRTLSVSLDYNFSENNMDGTNRSETVTQLYDDNYGFLGTETEEIDQKYFQYESGNRLGGRFSYTEPLYKERLFLEATYSINWSRSHSVNNTYNYNPATGQYDDGPDPVYSSELINEYIDQRAGLNLQWQKDGTVFALGASAQPNHTMNITTSQGVTDSTDYKVVNWAPTARIDWRPDDGTFFRLFYMGYSDQPSSTQLQPSMNVSNPLLITLGNNGLNPTFNHMLRAHFRYSNKETFLTLNGMLGGNYTSNSIINATWYDAAGVQYSIPVNSEGTYSANLRFMINSPIAKSDFSVSAFTNARYSNSTSYVGAWDMQINTEDFVYEDFIAEFHEAFADGQSFVKNKTNSLSVSQMLRFTYRNDELEVTLGARARYNQAWYSINKEQNTTTWNNNVNASVTYSLPLGFTIATDARYNYYIGYDEGFNEPQLIWNAHIDKLLFKDKFTLSIRMYDILNQSRNVYRTTTDNYVQDTRNNTLGRYIMISLTYRFGDFGGMGGGGNRGPMGPPPRR
ncbi:MAG: outer membrane beta-barrel protein [Muribaculum sp.]|uniref:Outer membrane beta-barrel protein n=1 Tax=Candidatus Merdivivens faecigallinarum TaxID=2840871 RepID=A0A9D9NPP9_9BACT|nr:outer membrane beta-barrel protein [Candidatus Merdivivens faecigallinarum]